MSFNYNRTIRFQDTDAAGVVYFANVLAICHEAYEESLAASGIPLKLFFSNPEVAIPIIHTSIDFFRPMFCGDQVKIQLIPKPLNEEKFEITYQIVLAEQIVAKAITKHICINPINRKKRSLPEEIIRWLHPCNELNDTSLP